ncbi:hypothetical protein ACFRAE_09975 [Sphingobacterium sp. HJSM2_6]|uniref:hypothetical protein n=1 Tax=Sphingobacterium sp. HJSM2_6 TaxID=3366264 RepID=UPI003BDC4DEF
MKNRLKYCFIFSIILAATFSLKAQQIQIRDFSVKENLSQNGKLAIIALDSLEKTDNSINGSFAFTINGFQQDLKFTDGVAVTSQSIKSSTFVFFKHENVAKDFGKLYFLRVTEQGITPYKIKGLFLIILPLAILFIAYIFKRFLVTLVILAIGYFYLNYSKGLDLKQVLESIIMGIKDLI